LFNYVALEFGIMMKDDLIEGFSSVFPFVTFNMLLFNICVIKK